MKSFQMFFLAMIFTVVMIKEYEIYRVFLKNTRKLFNVVNAFNRQKLLKSYFV